MSGSRPVPYTLPNRKRPGRAKFFSICGTPAITKYNIVDDLKLGFYLGTSEGLRNQDAIISSLLYLIDPAVMTRDLFMNKDIAGNVNMFNPPLVATNTASEAEGKLNKYIIGFAIVCHLGKPITQDNKTYVHKRLKAIGYACDDVNLSELRESKVVNMIDLSVFDEIKSNLAKAQAISPLLMDALKMPTDTALRKATLASFKMVFEGYGMTATKHMAHFCSILTKALLIEVVLNECQEFKVKYEAFIAKYPDNWKLGRLLGLPGVSDLDNSKYPHLYTCAVARASGPNGRGLGKYKKSKFQLKEDERTLTEAAMTNLTGKTVVTQGSGSSAK